MKKLAFGSICCIFTILAAMPAMAAKEPNAEEQIAPSGICVLQDGSYYAADIYNKVIWRNSGGQYTVAAGRIAPRGASNVPVGAYIDAELAEAAFISPWDITPFLTGYAVTDAECNTVRFFDNKSVQTIAGSNKAGYKDEWGIDAMFARPTGIATGDDGSLYVADTDNNVIRNISTDGIVTTYAGSKEGNVDGKLTAACFRQPTGLAYADGALYVADTGNHSIRLIKDGKVTTLAGRAFAEDTDEFYEGGYEDGDAASAMFASPQGVAVDGDNVYVADTMNAAIRLIKDGKVSTICENEDTAKNLYPTMPRGLAVSKDKLIVGDVFAKTIFTVDILPVEAKAAAAPTSLAPPAVSQPAAVSVPSTTQQPSSSAIWITILAVLAVAAIAVTLFIILKNKKQNK